MIDTNALLAATFAIIAEFHTVVNVPSQQIPKVPEEIRRVVIGSPFSPMGVFVEARNGSSYEVLDGSIRRYETVNSYMHLQDAQRLPKFMGVAKLNSNEVFTLAVTTIERLTKQGIPKTNGPPKFAAAGESHGATIPFCYVTWPLTNSPQGHAAGIEIDARSGEITFMHLPDRCFKNYALAQQISNRAYRAESPPLESRRAPTRRVLPQLRSNEVAQAIAALVRVCGKLAMEVGSQTNVAGVDWERSYPITNAELSATIPVLQIAFTNGGHVTAFDGAIIGYQLPDAYGNVDVPSVNPKQFFGKINKRWRDLAHHFEDVLSTNFGFRKELFSQFMAVTAWGYADAPVGDETLTRIMVIWLPYVDSSVPGYEAKVTAIPTYERGPGFGAEFDLQNGQMKSFGFFHGRLAEVFSRSQKSKN